MESMKVPFSRGITLNGQYFVDRFRLLGEEKFIEFVQGEMKYWGDHPKNLVIAKNVYKNLTNKDLPVMSEAETIESLRRENELLKAQKVSPVVVETEKESEPELESVETLLNTTPRRGRKVGS
jgi:hypothetical protein